MEIIKINIPEGKNASFITATPCDGCIEVCYELEDKPYSPEDGDFIFFTSNDVIDGAICIYRKPWGKFLGESFTGVMDTYAALSENNNFSRGITYRRFNTKIRKATEEEKQQLLDAMHKIGYVWDAENKITVPYRWRPKHDQYYWYINDEGLVIQTIWQNSCPFDPLRYEFGNCFKSKEEAEKMRNKLLELL